MKYLTNECFIIIIHFVPKYFQIAYEKKVNIIQDKM